MTFEKRVEDSLHVEIIHKNGFVYDSLLYNTIAFRNMKNACLLSNLSEK